VLHIEHLVRLRFLHEHCDVRLEKSRRLPPILPHIRKRAPRPRLQRLFKPLEPTDLARAYRCNGLIDALAYDQGESL
jgi:hypothetical protein